MKKSLVYFLLVCSFIIPLYLKLHNAYVYYDHSQSTALDYWAHIYTAPDTIPQDVVEEDQVLRGVDNKKPLKQLLKVIWRCHQVIRIKKLLNHL